MNNIEEKIKIIKGWDYKELIDWFERRCRMNPIIDEDLELVRAEILRRFENK